IAGGPKGNELKAQIEKGAYKGIAKTTLDGVNQIDYLTGKSAKSARDTFFYYSSSHPSAVRYKNWKMYFAIAPETATGFLLPGVQTQFAAGVVNLKRDPFETAWGDEKKANFWLDRKSTRLNSSHEWISYAVFCLKKKNKTKTNWRPQARSPASYRGSGCARCLARRPVRLGEVLHDQNDGSAKNEDQQIGDNQPDN